MYLRPDVTTKEISGKFVSLNNRTILFDPYRYELGEFNCGIFNRFYKMIGIKNF